MATDLKTWTKDLYNLTGSVLAGPAGALIGSLTGGMFTAALPESGEQFSAIFNRSISDSLPSAVEALVGRLDPIEKRHINHDLQTALRNALREAIYDLGGEHCFPQVWRERPRQVPANLIFLAALQGEGLGQAQDSLVEQICHFFKEMLNAIAEQRLLPLAPPLNPPAAAAYSLYPQADTPQALSEAFFDQVIRPFSLSFGTLTRDLPDLESSLRRNLIDRALIYLSEMLKARAPAWSAYNRVILEELRSQISRLDSAPTGFLAILDGLLEPQDSEGNPLPAVGRAVLTQWANSLADLLSAAGRLEKQAGESFEAVVARLGVQQSEVLIHFGLLLDANQRYEIEGVSAVALDEPPAPGDPPFKGLQSYSAEDADRFFGREALIARLVDRLRPVPSGHKRTNPGGNFLAVIGVPGCGKSSLVRAGLIPALQRGQPLANGDLPPEGSQSWPVHIITPTEHPLQALAESLTHEPARLVQSMQADPRALGLHILKILGPETATARNEKKQAQQPKDSLILIVDQFEEIFLLCRQEAEGAAFLDNLLGAIDFAPVILVILLRADFYARCMEDEYLRQSIAARQEYIGEMSAAELRRAIEEPARRGGWQFESGLVSVILHDLGADEWQYNLPRSASEPRSSFIRQSSLGPPGLPQSGALDSRYTLPARCHLPALSHALLETWKHRRGRIMTLESYAESGGVHGAITKTAETAFEKLDAGQQALTRYIFLQLTGLTGPAAAGEEYQETGFLDGPYRRVPLSVLTSSPATAAACEEVLSALAESGLITLEAGSACLVSATLIQEWPRLHKWLEEQEESLRLYHRIGADAREWRRLNDNPGVVYRGARLAQALEWAEGHPELFEPLAQEFLEFSKFAAARQADAEAARLEAQRQRDIESARQQTEEAETRQKAEDDVRQLEAQTARRQRIRSFLSASVAALIVLAAILALVFAGASRQQKVHADQRAETALQEQAAALAASTQAAAGQLTAQAEARAHATAEVDALGQKSAADAARLEAQRQSRVSLAREFAALSTSFTGRDADLALLLASAAINITVADHLEPVGEAQTALFHALQSANFSGVLRGHTDEVLSAVYSPDGKYILTTSKDGTARLWDRSSQEAILLRTYSGGITSAAFSPDGTRLLTTGSDQGQDGVAELWGLDGTQVATLSGHTGIVYWGSFSPDGALIVTAGQDKTARLWKADGTPIATLSGHTNTVTAARFSPDRTRLITLSADATARLWNPDGSPLATLAGHTRRLLDAYFSPDGSRIVTASADGTARLWLADGTPVATLEGHTGEVTTAVFSPNGQWVLTAGFDGTARLWRADGSPVMVLGITTSGVLPNPIYMAIFSPDGTQILTAGGDATARLWHTDGTLITSLAGHTQAVFSAQFSADGRQIVTASADQTARVWDIDKLYASPLAHLPFGLTWAGFSPDGTRVLTTAQDGIARLYRLDGVQTAVFTGHTGELTNASFSPDGQLIATASRDGTARIWRPDGTFLVELKGHAGPVSSTDFSPDSKLVVTASEDGTARLYRVSGSLILALEGHTGAVWSAFFSPDGSRIATASQDGTTRIWSIDGQLLHTIENHAVPVKMAAFSPDGQMVITTGQDGMARLWLADGTPLVSLQGHSDMVNWAAFSPDGKLIATASNDGTTRLWSIDGNFLAGVEGHPKRVASTGFSPDGKFLVTASWDGTARLWSTFENLEAMQAEAASRVGRGLTESECQQILHQETCPPSP